MKRRWLINPKTLILTSITLLLFAAVACGGTAATPVVVEKEVVKEVPVVKEVIKEVPLVKEVIREIVDVVLSGSK